MGRGRQRQGWGGGSVGRAGGSGGEQQRLCPVPRRAGCAVGEPWRRGVPAQGWPGQPGPVRCAPPPDDELRCGGSPVCRRARRPCPRLRQPGRHSSGVGSSAKAAPAALHAAEGCLCRGGSGEVPPAQQGPSVSLRNFPGKRCGCQ